jgi:hemolysin D
MTFKLPDSIKPLFMQEVDDAHAFQPILVEIEQEPVSPMGRTVFWVVISTFLFFTIWSIIGKMDIVITARGKVMPVGGVKVMQPLATGIISGIHIVEGQYVHKGQLLISIDPQATDPTMASYKESLLLLEAERSRMAASTGQRGFSGNDGNATQRALLSASEGRMRNQLDAKAAVIRQNNAKIGQTRTELARTRQDLTIQSAKLQKYEAVRDIIARQDYDTVNDKVMEDQAKIKELIYQLQQTAHENEQTNKEMAALSGDFQTSTLTDLSDREKRIAELKGNVGQLKYQSQHQAILAPVDGFVEDLNVHTIGGVVTPAQKIVSIVPVKAPLKIEAIIVNRDIGYVKTGLPVALKVDTFEFQRYGTLLGKVTNVPKDSEEDKQLGRVYKVDIAPLQSRLKVDGHWEKLSNGMTVDAEIKVGQRRIIEFLIYPLIKHWHEGLSVR